MKVEGLNLSEEVITLLKEWCLPMVESDTTTLQDNIMAIESAQTYFMEHWDEIGTDDIKTFLLSLNWAKTHLTGLNNLILSQNKGVFSHE